MDCLGDDRDFLRRRLWLLLPYKNKLEEVERSYENLAEFVGAAADRYLGRAFVTASLYLLGGNERLLDATDLLERAKNAYAQIGKFAEANLCYVTKACLPLIEQRAIWNLIANASDSGLWKRYLETHRKRHDRSTCR